MRRLQNAGIECRPSWKPMHMQPLCSGFELQPHSPVEIVSSSVFLQSLCLPSGSAMTESTQDRIIDMIRNLVTENAA